MGRFDKDRGDLVRRDNVSLAHCIQYGPVGMMVIPTPAGTWLRLATSEAQV
jgi:hypothetical protein